MLNSPVFQMDSVMLERLRLEKFKVYLRGEHKYKLVGKVILEWEVWNNINSANKRNLMINKDLITRMSLQKKGPLTFSLADILNFPFSFAVVQLYTTKLSKQEMFIFVLVAHHRVQQSMTTLFERWQFMMMFVCKSIYEGYEALLCCKMGDIK
jgi:hypothetical protein